MHRSVDISSYGSYGGGVIKVIKDVPMSKRELIDCICEINRTAKPEFLATFSEDDLNDYLEHLMELDLEALAVCA